MQKTEYGPGDVVRFIAEGRIIPHDTHCLFVRYSYPDKAPVVEYRGIHITTLPESIELYRRHIDSPLRAADNERFWKLHPPTKRAKGAK